MVKWIDYKGNPVLLLDYSGLKDETLLAAFNEVEAFILADGRTQILELVDVTDAYTNLHAFERLKQMTVTLKPYVGRTAVIGLSGVKQTLVDIISRVSNRKIKSFTDRQTALDWLIYKE